MAFKMIGNQISKSCKNLRGIRLISGVQNANNNFTEINIEVPWGKIAGKHWNPHLNKQPILALHGFLDNASSFDTLAPLLKNSSIIAIDFPGHGFSSWLPPGIPYSHNIFIQIIRHIKHHFGWDNVKFLGHSFGGVMSYNYAVIYPEDPKFVISLDSLGFVEKSVKERSKAFAKGIDDLITFEKKQGVPPIYTENEAIKKWIDASFLKSLDIEITKILMTRGAKKQGDNKFSFTRDFRLIFGGFHQHYFHINPEVAAKLLMKPCFALLASESNYPGKESWLELEKAMKMKNKEFICTTVVGNHHIHMSQPEKVLEKIGSFLEKYDT